MCCNGGRSSSGKEVRVERIEQRVWWSLRNVIGAMLLEGKRAGLFDRNSDAGKKKEITVTQYRNSLISGCKRRKCLRGFHVPAKTAGKKNKAREGS